MDKSKIIAALDKWIRQRPGLEFGNYGDRKAYAAELRSITKDGAEAKRLLRAVELRDSITGDAIADASRHSFAGRMELIDKGGSVAIEYTTGQYWPTEYRRAACAVLASALWDHVREHCMPAAIVRDGDKFYPHAGGGKNEQSAGEWLRAYFVREFGRGIAKRWFN